MAKFTGRGNSRRQEAQLLERRNEAFRRFKAGESLGAIAKDFRVSASTICVDCKLALEEWRESHRASVAEMVEAEWQNLNYVGLEARLSWEQSKGPQKTKPGDARYLEMIMRAGEQRRKLLGLDKPTRIESQTTTEVTVSTSRKTLAEMKAEVLKRQQALEVRKAEAKGK